MFRQTMPALALVVFALGAHAEKQAQYETVTLDVENMTCAMCPITVRKALEKVPGVIEAEAKYEGKGVGWARVTFDPQRTDVEALRRATAEAGYPSSVKEQAPKSERAEPGASS